MIDWLYFKFLQVKMRLVIFLGGQVTREVIKPLYRPMREFGEIEYDELSRVFSQAPILHDFLHILIDYYEGMLTDLSTERQDDRYRIKIISKIQTLREILNVPETALRRMQELREENRTEQFVYNNLGVKNDTQQTA